MNKIKKLLYFILTFLFFISCAVRGYTFIDKIIKLSKNKEIVTLLKYPVKSNESPSGRFIFVFAKGAEPYDDDNVLMKDALKRDFKIDNYIFKKGEFKWWFIYDVSKKKIIIKGSDLVLLRDVIWEENKFYFIFNFGTTPGTNLKFYDLKNTNNRPFILEAYYLNIKSYLFSNNLNYIAYQYEVRVDDFSGMPLEIGIKIRYIGKNEDISTINPSTENGILEIIKWESDNKLIYKEIDKNTKIAKEMSYIIK